MTTPTIYDGTGKPSPQTLVLRAGHLTALYEDGTLRYIHAGEHEIVRQIYSAVRDQNWGTLLPILSDVNIKIYDDSFKISYVSTHRQDDIHFVWRGTIIGTPDSTITFEMDGEALTTFKRNRIGFCVLHPMTVAGSNCHIEHVDGEVTNGRFPTDISPHQPYLNIRAINHTIDNNVRATVRMEGETFEMEDQRNWIDASYKTYCTPLDLPFPHIVEKGTKVQQKITITLQGDVVANPIETPLTFFVSDTQQKKPKLGFVLNKNFDVDEHGSLLKIAQPNFVRMYLTPSEDDVFNHIAVAFKVSKFVGCGVEFAIWLKDDVYTELKHVYNALQVTQSTIERFFIFKRGEKITSRHTLQQAHEILGELNVPIGGGTDAFFTELNRNHPDLDSLDGVNYSVNPQVHAFDNASLVETASVIQTTLQTAKTFCGDKPLSVAPITLKMRWNPNATTPEPPQLPDKMPRQVDVRQASLLGAGWTLSAIHALAEGGADYATFYETIGMLGIMAKENSAIGAQFPAPLGAVYPMFHIFADVNEWQGAVYKACYASNNLHIDGIVLQKDNHVRLILANLKATEQNIRLKGLMGKFAMRILDETSAQFAMTKPKEFRAQVGDLIPIQDGTSLTLKPYALVTLTHMAD